MRTTLNCTAALECALPFLLPSHPSPVTHHLAHLEPLPCCRAAWLEVGAIAAAWLQVDQAAAWLSAAGSDDDDDAVAARCACALRTCSTPAATDRVRWLTVLISSSLMLHNSPHRTHVCMHRRAEVHQMPALTLTDSGCLQLHRATCTRARGTCTAIASRDFMQASFNKT